MAKQLRIKKPIRMISSCLKLRNSTMEVIFSKFLSMVTISLADFSEIRRLIFQMDFTINKNTAREKGH